MYHIQYIFIGYGILPKSAHYIVSFFFFVSRLSMGFILCITVLQTKFEYYPTVRFVCYVYVS